MEDERGSAGRADLPPILLIVCQASGTDPFIVLEFHGPLQIIRQQPDPVGYDTQFSATIDIPVCNQLAVRRASCLLFAQCHGNALTLVCECLLSSPCDEGSLPGAAKVAAPRVMPQVNGDVMQIWLPIRLVQGRIENEIKANLSAVRQHAERLHAMQGSPLRQ